MNDDPLYRLIGVKGIVLAAGFLGGVVSLAFIKALTVRQAFIAVLTGLCCAAFITPVATHYGLPPVLENSTGFLLGLWGMSIAGKLYRYGGTLSMSGIVSTVVKRAFGIREDIGTRKDKGGDT